MLKTRNKDGFTLIEVAIVLLIGGILLGTLSVTLQTYLSKTALSTSRAQIKAIDEALQLFLSLNGRYPCPARMDAAIDTNGFGSEISNDCSAAAVNAGETIRTAGRDGRNVRIGAVPVRTLNLPDDFIGDAWSGRYLYAVTEALASPGTYSRDEGAIDIIDSNDLSFFATPGIAHYAIISHGRNNSGAVSFSGAGVTPCPAGTWEEENCNGDDTFRSTLLTGDAAGATQYDDLVTFRSTSPIGDFIPAGAVMAFNLVACPDGWIQYATGQDRVIIGAGGVHTNGELGGETSVSLTDSEVGFQESGTRFFENIPSGSPGATAAVEAIPSGGAAHENKPLYVALLYCEKT